MKYYEVCDKEELRKLFSILGDLSKVVVDDDESPLHEKSIFDRLVTNDGSNDRRAAFIMVIASPTTRVEQLSLMYKAFIAKDSLWVMQPVPNLSLWRKLIRPLVIMWLKNDCYLQVFDAEYWSSLKRSSVIGIDA